MRAKRSNLVINKRGEFVGKHSFEIQAKDKSGKVESTPAQVWFEVDVDKQPPETHIINPPDTPLKSNEYTFNFSGADLQTKPDDLEYSWCLSRIPPQKSEKTWSGFSKATSVHLEKLDDGIYLFEVKAKDEAGNEDESPAQVHFEVAVNAPDTTITNYPKAPLTKSDSTFRCLGHAAAMIKNSPSK